MRHILIIFLNTMYSFDLVENWRVKFLDDIHLNSNIYIIAYFKLFFLFFNDITSVLLKMDG